MDSARDFEDRPDSPLVLVYNVQTYFRKSNSTPNTNDDAAAASLCSFCQTLDFAKIFLSSSVQLLDPVECHLTRFITWDGAMVLQNTHCAFCSLLRDAVFKRLGGTAEDGSTRFRYIMGHVEDFKAVSYSGPIWQPETAISAGGRRLWVTASMECYDQHGDSAHHDDVECRYVRANYDRCIQAPLLQPLDEYVDSHIVQTWLRLCQCIHYFSCEPRRPPAAYSFQLRVVDVDKGCITDAAPGCQYLALSYPWEGVDQLRLTTGNRHMLVTERPGLTTFAGASLTVMDAMHFCRQIGQRYLWVDTLCIIQDDEADRTEQLKSMGLIYDWAQATIVAAAGWAASYGLPGVTYRRDRVSTQKVEDLELAASLRHSIQSITNSAWNSRAWTFQEMLFSRRMIIFTEDQMVFSCNKAVWREDRVAEPGHDDNPPFQRSSLGASLQALQDETARLTQPLDSRLSVRALSIYQGLICHYVIREIGNPEDILDAFAGLQSVLEPYLGPFRWGLPSCGFEAMLTWRYKAGFPLPRRERFPSWSWAGWHGFEWLADLFPKGVGGSAPAFAWGHGAEVTYYQVREEDGSLDAIANEKPHAFSAAVLDAHLRAQTRSKHHVDRVDLPRDPPVPLAHLLVLWTSSVYFTVSRQRRRHLEVYTGVQYDQEEFTVMGDDGSRVGTICLDPAWREKQLDALEFIVVATDSRCDLLAMLIVWDRGVAFRVQMTSDPIRQKDWRGSRRKMIILG